ncbi:MAG: LysM peptidoglycan-binding domain-containing protein [Myxococcota bacterium]
MRPPERRLPSYVAMAAAGALLIGAGGCFDGCADDDDRETPPDAAAAAAPAKEPDPGAEDAGAVPAPEVHVEHAVRAGQTLWDIAHSYGVTVSDVMEANDLSPGDIRRLREGQTLKIPGATEGVEVLSASERRKKQLEELPEPENGAYHFLAPGETLWHLARTYDVTADDIMVANDFSDSDARGLREGQPVIIPGVTKDQIQRTEPQKRQGIQHTLAFGETVWDLANAFQVSVAEIMAANGLSTSQVTQLREGMDLFIPNVTRDKKTGKVRRTLSPRQRQAKAKAKLLGLGTRRTATLLLGGRVKDEWIRAAGGQRLPGTLRWPVTNGWYTRGFGSGMGGYHQAVDIMGEIGWNVRAAARGIVAYSGDGVRGYGNMVMVVHPGGWVTMYAHNSVNFVVAGERVPRGGILAEVGSTGISRGPHVHFELIHAGTNCDPAPLFRPGVKHRGGKIHRGNQITWRNPSGRPRAIDCGRRRRHPKSRWVVHENPEAN